MKKHALTRTHPSAAAAGAAASGAVAAGAASLGVFGIGAVALGAIAVGALAIGRLKVGRARLRRVEIAELAVGRLAIGSVGLPGGLAAVARVRAAPGMGDALERLLAEQLAESGPGTARLQAHRSLGDPDLFLFHETFADEPDEDQDGPASRLGALLRLAVGEGLVAAPEDEPLDLDLYRMV